MADVSVCPDCLELVGACTCIWKIMRLEPNYSVYCTASSDNKLDNPPFVTMSPTCDEFYKVYN